MDGAMDKYIPGALAIVAVLAGAITNHLLNRRSKQRELMWQMKLEGYTEVVVTLQKFLSHARQFIKTAGSPDASSDSVAKAQAAALEQLRALDDIHNRSYLLFSKEFARETERIQRGIKRIGEEEQSIRSKYMRLANPALLDLVEEGGKRLEAIAKSELK
jgi:hypothetical protein